MSASERPERRRDLERFLTLIDAIVAIAITLLVLPLVEVTADLGDEPVSDVLGDSAGQLAAFFLSFAVIARLWAAQHRAVSSLLTAPPRLGVLVSTWCCSSW